ncbi:hypothetical protein [Desulfallas thermosapovorans]|uniref:Uncharacterized protein n=1 Tax=Desulfallas thermosapovorans DSM 6562 TaxID=1121431 RepID=A0A5S4ZU38_9FIRM|nr:hypothetical protein [Desulfallas thermosapovorans]TYO96497.1 hypothetical protein LX24_00965 [Desulfallas thermosapovorans DSM 6562]
MLQTLLFFTQGIPECTGLLACTLALVRVEIRWKIVITTAVVFTGIIYIIRNLPVTFGLHTVVAILIYAVFISKATRVPPSISFMAVFITVAVLLFVEARISELFRALLSNEITIMLSAYSLWQLTGLPQGILLIAGAILISKYRKPVDDMWRI